MEMPTWAKIIGVMMIIFGGCGVAGNLSTALNPDYLNKMDDMMTEAKSEILKEVKENDQTDSLQVDTMAVQADIEVDSLDKGKEFVLDFMDKMNMSDYLKKWLYIFSIMGVIMGLLFLLGGLFLFIKKTFSIKLALGVIAMSLCYDLFRIIIMNMDEGAGFISGFSNLGNYLSLVIDIFLLIIIAIGDKTFYEGMVDV